MLHRFWTRSRFSRPAAPSARPRLEGLEDRLVPSVTTVYTETNNPADGQNAVLAFHRNENGSLTRIGSYATGGTGQINLPKVIGPDDGDHQVEPSPDGRFLYAVNQGSDSISAFRIQRNGSLDLVGTFDSGGVQPDGLSIADGRLFVANRGDATATQTGTVAPNVTGFDIGLDGSLSPIAGSTVEFPIDTFATQPLLSRNGRLLFVQVASLSGAPEGNTVAPFQVRSDGTLQVAPGGALGASDAPTIQLGLAFHPHLNILYDGLTAAGQVGVYTYDETGRLSFVGSSPDRGAAGCWITVSADGRVLYVTNTGSNTVGVFSLADPLHPVEIQDYALRGPRTDQNGNRITADFEVSLDPTGRSLYVVNQSTSPDGTAPQGNQLHTLAVARDGTLTERSGPIIFSLRDVPADAHPQGIAVVGGRRGGGGEDGPDTGSFNSPNASADLELESTAASLLQRQQTNSGE
jgi:DNA-binding beta-propeller fold protein YncE